MIIFNIAKWASIVLNAPVPTRRVGTMKKRQPSRWLFLRQHNLR